MKKNSSLPALALLAVVPLLPLGAASLTPLGDLPGGAFSSVATGVSADGGTVTGYSSSANGQEAFRWNAGMMTGLGDLPGGAFESFGHGISADGTTITGHSYSANGTEAFRWNAGVMTGLGDLPGNFFGSAGQGTSADGATISGYSYSANGLEAFRWNGGAMTGLGDLAGGEFYSRGEGVSADGATIAGTSISAIGTEAFRWNAGVMTGLGDLPGGIFGSNGMGISADGSTIVGFGSSANGPEAFRWNAGVMTGLGDLPGGNFYSLATSVSADGDTIVGYGTTTLGSEAFVWTAGGGMESLASRLLASGLDPAGDGWSRLWTARSLSPDGRYVVGTGIRHGNNEAFLADLGPVNQRPVIAQPVAAQLASLGQAFTFTLPADTFSDPDAGQTLTYSVSGLPSWLNFEPGTRTFSGTPAALGQSTVTVRATDDGTPPRFAETTFTLTVLGTAVPPLGLVAWWRGFGNADDVFGRANGTFANGMTAAGGIFSLDGSDDAMVIGQPPILDQPNGTWSAWIRPAAAPIGRYAVVMSRWDNEPGGNSVSLFLHRPGPGSEWFFQGNIAHGPAAPDSQFALSPAIIQPDTWTHVALTFDDATDSLKIYLNGELQGTASQAGSLFHGNGQWRIGFNPHPSVGTAFPGQISDPMIFSRALSGTELQALTAAGIGGFALNTPPAVATAIADQAAQLGRPFTFTLPAGTFSDPDAGQTLTYSASGLPGWLSFDPVTRTFTGTPTALGASTITVTATDSGALGVSTPFTVRAGFSPDAVVARYNFVASGWSEPGVPSEVRGSFTATFEPITGNGFNVAELDAVVFQVNGVTYSAQNTGLVVQNGRRTGAVGANHEGRFELGGLASGGVSSLGGGNHDFRLAFTDFSGVIDPPSFMFSKPGGGIFVASSVTVTRAAAAPVFTAKYAFSATGFSPAGPDATVAGTFTATFKHTGLTGGAGWVPSILEMLELTINGVAQDPATADLNVRNVSVSPQGFTARFELGGRFSAYGGGMNTDDFHLYFTDFGGIGDGIAVPQFVYTTTQALGFHTAATVNVTRVAADPLPGGDLAVDQPAGSPVWSGLTTVDFGPISAGAPVGRTFTVRNLGAGTLGGLTATVLGAAAADFSVGGLPGGPLAADGDTTFTVTCNPTAGGTRTATLRLRSSDPRENPFDVPITAVGLLPEIAVEQPAGTGLADGTGNVAFGPTAVGGAPLARSFTVRNTGTGQLSLAGVSVTGGQAGDFTVEAGSLPLVLGPGGQASFSVAFVPAAIGLRGTTLVITSNDADEATFEVALLGIGTVNLPPTGTPDTIRRLSSSEIAKVPVATLLGNDSDPDGDPLSVVGVGDAQPAGASVGMAGGWVTYRAPGPGPGAGSFTYTLGDGQGHTVVVSVTVNDYSEPPTTSGLANAQRITPAGDDITLTFFGVPGRSYRVQFTTEGAPPYAWTEFSPPADYVAPANGVFTHTDSQPAGPVRLYRAVAR